MAIKDTFRLLGTAFRFLSAGGIISDILALTVIGLICAGIYMKGRTDANLANAKAGTAGIEQSVKEYGQIKRGVMQMDEPSIDRALNEWMRD